MQRSKLRRVLLVALVSLVAGDAAVSVLFLRDDMLGWKRPVPPFGAITHPQQRDWLEGQKREIAGTQLSGVIGRFDAELGWCNDKSRGTAPDAPQSYTYNSIGARAQREYEPEPPAGVVRVVCYGESFTHCDEVGDLETWEHQIEELAPSYEVLDFGVGGYGTDQALLRFRREGLRGAQVACMGFMFENIGRNVNRYRPLWHPSTNSCVAKPRLVLEHDRLSVVPLPYRSREELIDAITSGRVIDELAEHEYWGDETRMGWLRFSSCLRLAATWWAYERRDVPRLFADTQEEPYTTTIALLEAFVREAREHGAKLAAIVLLPREEDLAQLELDHDRYWSDFAGDLERRGMLVIDTTAALGPAWLAAHNDASKPRLYSGSHLSGAANAIVARAVHTAIEAHLHDSR